MEADVSNDTPVIRFTQRDMLTAIVFWTVVALVAGGVYHQLKHDARVYEMEMRV